MNFASIIRDARTCSGLSQSELAFKAGVGIATVWRIEKDGHGTMEVLARLCRALDLRFTGLPRRENFGDQVRTLRTRRGWSQGKLADRIGVSIGSITRLENGNARVKTLSDALKVLAPDARVRKSEIPHWGVAPSRDERFTPKDMVTRIERVIGAIALDPCGHPNSTVRAEKFYYAEDDGLVQPWKARTIYISPPYSSAADFIRKAYETWKAGDCETVLALLQIQMHHHWVHEYLVGRAEIFFLRGRIAFDRAGKPSNPAPFGNMIIIYGADEAIIGRMLAEFDCVHLPKEARVGRVEARQAIQNPEADD